jgi:hypothetical protein
MLSFRGKELSVRYNDGSIWIVMTAGKDMHLTKDYFQDIGPLHTFELHANSIRSAHGICAKTWDAKGKPLICLEAVDLATPRRASKSFSYRSADNEDV